MSRRATTTATQPSTKARSTLTQTLESDGRPAGGTARAIPNHSKCGTHPLYSCPAFSPTVYAGHGFIAREWRNLADAPDLGSGARKGVGALNSLAHQEGFIYSDPAPDMRLRRPGWPAVRRLRWDFGLGKGPPALAPNAQARLLRTPRGHVDRGPQRLPATGRHIACDSEDAGHEPNRSFCTLHPLWEHHLDT